MKLKAKKDLNKEMAIRSDAPELYLSEDLLGMHDFVDNLYSTINVLKPDNGFVISLTSEWGNGKTTVVNFLKEKRIRNYDKSTFIIMDFSPWNIIDKQTLLKNFFIQLKQTISDEFGKNKSVSIIEEYSKAIIAGVSIIPKLNKFSQFFSEIYNVFTKKQEKSINDLKNEIVTFLQTEEINKNIVIVIDDLDRLSDDEICIVLKLIKEIADFPKIIYFLPIDKEYVSRAIKNYYKYDTIEEGKKYLEKFIQLDWSLPTPSPKIIRLYITKSISSFLSIEEYKSAEEYFETILNCIENRIGNLRKAKLIFNSFTVKYNMNKEFINYADCFALIFIQFFYSKLFEFIKSEKQLLLEELIFDENNKIRNEGLFKDYFHDYINDIPFYKEILCTLFPKFASNCAFVNTLYDEQNILHRNIGNKFCYDSYFEDGNKYIEKKYDEIQQIVIKNDFDEIVNYMYSSDSKSVFSIQAKSSVLLETWSALKGDYIQFRNIIKAILIANRHDIVSACFYEIKLFFKKRNSPLYFSQSLKTIIKEMDIGKLNISFFTFLSLADEEEIISDMDFRTMLAVYSRKLLRRVDLWKNRKKQVLIDLLIKHSCWGTISNILKMNMNNSVYVIYNLFSYDSLHEKIGFTRFMISRDSESYWKDQINGMLSIMKWSDDVIKGYLINLGQIKTEEGQDSAFLQNALTLYSRNINLDIDK